MRARCGELRMLEASSSSLFEPASPAAALNVTPCSAPVANAESSPRMPLWRPVVFRRSPADRHRGRMPPRVGCRSSHGVDEPALTVGCVVVDDRQVRLRRHRSNHRADHLVIERDLDIGATGSGVGIVPSIQTFVMSGAGSPSRANDAARSKGCATPPSSIIPATSSRPSPRLGRRGYVQGGDLGGVIREDRGAAVIEVRARAGVRRAVVESEYAVNDPVSCSGRKTGPAWPRYSTDRPSAVPAKPFEIDAEHCREPARAAAHRHASRRRVLERHLQSCDVAQRTTRSLSAWS